ncbi:TraG family conjugative transposon ATPase [Salegentibacter sp. F14]
MKKINLNAQPPLCYINGNFAISSNGNIMMGYQLDLPEIFGLDEKNFEELFETWFQAFKVFNPGIIIQRIDRFEKTPFHFNDPGKATTYLSEATEKYFTGRSYLKQTSYLFFIQPGPGQFPVDRWKNPFKTLSIKEVENLQEGAESFKESVKDCELFLNNSGPMKLRPFSLLNWQTFTKAYFNLFQKNPTDVESGKGFVKVGQKNLRSVIINNEKCFNGPVKTHKSNASFSTHDFSFPQGFLDGLGLKAFFDHMLIQCIFLDSNRLWMKSLEKQREALKKSVRFGSLNQVNLERVEDLMQRINRDDQARIVRGHMQVILWEDSRQALQKNISQINSAFRALDIEAYLPGPSENMRYFITGYPGNLNSLETEDFYITDLKHCLCLYMNSGNFKEDPSGIYFNDRLENIPIRKDLWDEEKKRIKARNFAIFAPTGEGKSFLANNILRQFFESGTRLVIIDLGGSYGKLARLYPKDHIIIRYQHGEPLGINPFYFIQGDPTPDQLEELADFLFELTAWKRPVSKSHKVLLKKILQEFYERENEADLEKFYNYLLAIKKDHGSIYQGDHHLNLEQFILQLSEYTGQGLYRFLFSQEDQQERFRLEDKRFIIFELDEVKDNQELLAVMLKLIKTAVQKSIWQNPGERGVILFDEFAKQLKFGDVLESVEFYYQAIRKQNAAIGIVLQSINQLPEDSVAASILENTQIIYSLRNEKGYDLLVRRLHLSKHDHQLLRTIRNNLVGSRKYTEVFIKIGSQSNIYRLEVPPEVYAAYLTDGKDHQQILELHKRSGNMEKAIEQFLNQQS